MALWVVLALPIVKILATSLSIGSCGSGGIFGPGMVIGGFVGLGLWRVLEGVAPGVPNVPAPFMVVGMIACFGSVAHAPLGLMLMVAEMTGSLALLPPAMVAIDVATLVVGNDTIYESQLRSRADAPAHRAAFGLPLLSAVMVADVMTAPPLAIAADTPFSETSQLLQATNLSGSLVVDNDGVFNGVISPNDSRRDGVPTAAAAADPRTPLYPPTRDSTSPSTSWSRPSSPGYPSSTPTMSSASSP